ncbi:unnamed protein product [Lota lota]
MEVWSSDTSGRLLPICHRLTKVKTRAVVIQWIQSSPILPPDFEDSQTGLTRGLGCEVKTEDWWQSAMFSLEPDMKER